MSHLDDLDEFEAELELAVKREYSAVFPLFRYCVLTPDETYLCQCLINVFSAFEGSQGSPRSSVGWGAILM